MEGEYSELACEEFEYCEGFDDDATTNLTFDEDSMMSSQNDQTRDGEEEEEELLASKEGKSGHRKRRRDSSLSTYFSYNAEEEEDEQQAHMVEKRCNKSAYSFYETSAMMLQASAQGLEEGEVELELPREEEEEEERTMGRGRGEKKARKAGTTNTTNNNTEDKENVMKWVMGLNDDFQMDFDEMFCEMLKKERTNPRSCRWDSSLATHRGKLVDWLNQMAEKKCLGLSERTVHLCVDILDAINAGLTQESLYLAALAALLISCKHEEVEEKVPTIEELCLATGGRFANQFVIKMELLVLHKIGWEMMRVTSVLFLQNFIRRGACKLYLEQDVFDGRPMRFEQVAALEGYVNKYATFFCDVCLQDIELSQEQHSVVAAASLMCARRVLKVTPLWTESLRKITTYDIPQLAPFMSKLWDVYARTFNNAAP